MELKESTKNIKNKVSASADLVNGGRITFLENADPLESLEEYLCHYVRPPDSTYYLTITDSKGKTVEISICRDGIIFSNPV
jgi:hypothetical protein